MKKYNHGIGSLEVLIGAAIIISGILALIVVFNSFFSFALANDENVRAAYLGEEALEAMTFLRDGSWSTNIASLSTTTAYYLTWNSGALTWRTTTTTPRCASAPEWPWSCGPTSSLLGPSPKECPPCSATRASSKPQCSPPTRSRRRLSSSASAPTTSRRPASA